MGTFCSVTAATATSGGAALGRSGSFAQPMSVTNRNNPTETRLWKALLARRFVCSRCFDFVTDDPNRRDSCGVCIDILLVVTLLRWRPAQSLFFTTASRQTQDIFTRQLIDAVKDTPICRNRKLAEVTVAPVMRD